MTFFGCNHPRISWPQPSKQYPGLDYICCLECGREFPYDFKQMKVLSEPMATLISCELQGEKRRREIIARAKQKLEIRDLERMLSLGGVK